MVSWKNRMCPRDLSRVKLDEWSFRLEETTFFLGRENIVPSSGRHLMRWREKLFIFMSRNARSASSFFNLPPKWVVELGVQIMLNPSVGGKSPSDSTAGTP